MIKTLVSTNADLATSIALRYACQLADLTGMVLQTMPVVEPEQEGHSPGTGWVPFRQFARWPVFSLQCTLTKAAWSADPIRFAPEEHVI